MSTTGSFATKKAAHHRRNDSGELDVFEAARYFSSIPDTPSGDRLIGWVGGGRRSLDLSMQHINPHHTYSHRLEKHHHHHPKEKRSNKHKQPSSPGAKLASFLNSLFSQASSKKNKSKSGSSGSGTLSARRDEEGSPNERRKRRSSISYFQTRSTKDSHSMCSSSNSGFRTPPPKVFRDVSLPSCNVQQPKPVPVHPSHEAFDEKQDLGWGWMDGKLRLKEGFGEIPSNDQRRLEKDGKEADDDQAGWESESSSDLFELKNYDLGLYSNGLPVYETTLVGPVK
ncbi:hypothetical protein ACLOJK_035908 [Asimina triloba]